MKRLPLLALTSIALAFGCGDDKEDDPDFGGDGMDGSGTGTGPGNTGPTGDGGGGTTGGGGDSGDSGGGSGTGGGTCGNGVVEGTEQCDGMDLAGASCESLGEGSGTLACDSVLCTYDTSMCMGGGGSTSSGGM